MNCCTCYGSIGSAPHCNVLPSWPTVKLMDFVVETVLLVGVHYFRCQLRSREVRKNILRFYVKLAKRSAEAGICKATKRRDVVALQSFFAIMQI